MRNKLTINVTGNLNDEILNFVDEIFKNSDRGIHVIINYNNKENIVEVNDNQNNKFEYDEKRVKAHIEDVRTRLHLITPLKNREYIETTMESINKMVEKSKYNKSTETIIKEILYIYKKHVTKIEELIKTETIGIAKNNCLNKPLKMFNTSNDLDYTMTYINDVNKCIDSISKVIDNDEDRDRIINNFENSVSFNEIASLYNTDIIKGKIVLDGLLKYTLQNINKIKK